MTRSRYHRPRPEYNKGITNGFVTHQAALSWPLYADGILELVCCPRKDPSSVVGRISCDLQEMDSCTKIYLGVDESRGARDSPSTLSPRPDFDDVPSLNMGMKSRVKACPHFSPKPSSVVLVWTFSLEVHHDTSLRMWYTKHPRCEIGISRPITGAVCRDIQS